MPTVNVFVDQLESSLNQKFTPQEFEELCFEFGIELEEVTSEKEMATKEIGGDKAKGLSERMIYRIDIPANRYDMLCAEGISRALKTFLGKEAPPSYKTIVPKELTELYIKHSSPLRPHVVAAILRNITFTQDIYDGFIEFQDKLHSNICRKRTLVAIGTHDLDSVQAPFSYEMVSPSDISFTPLNQTSVLNGSDLVKFYEDDRKLSKFLHIIKDSEKFPVIYDAKRRVMSLPPIINSDHSKIKMTTKNVFIECTATDLTKAKIVLNTIVTMFSEHCKDPFSIEPVKVIQHDGTCVVYPDLTPRTVLTSLTYINNSIGVQMSADQVVELLNKMSVPSTLDATKTNIIASIPPTRSDILHSCDIMEDVAIAYGYNNILETMPKSCTIAAPLAINKLSDLVRKEIALSGYSEGLSFTLCSGDENYKFLRRLEDGLAVKLANPKTLEYEVVRTSLLPGILKTVCANKRLALPLKVFEVSDIVVKDDTVERRARNERHVAAVYCSKTSGFEHIHGLVDRIMTMLHVPLDSTNGYCIRESNEPTYFPGRQASILYHGIQVGSFGILHPEVLSHFEITYPCSSLEFDLSPFL